MVKNTTFLYLESSHWSDYALLDSGQGQKLERFGAYTFIRPEVQSMWSRMLPEAEWSRAHAVFQSTREESGGNWEFKQEIADKWKMQYGPIRFWAMTTSGRHLGVFPECTENWDWVADIIRLQKRPVNILNLFGYTGLATLSAAAAGASVTHVDASKKAVAWARENQALSGLTEKPVRWIVEDALKFVQREVRRGNYYDGIILDPPKFGRGPKGEIWEVYKSLPNLMRACNEVLGEQPLFFVMTIYAVKASAIHAEQMLAETMSKYNGSIESGELVVREQSAGRLLSQAVFARWCAEQSEP